MSKNYFLDDDTAVRYHQYRPMIHDAIVDQIASFCLPSPPVEKALDVACGTGHSTYPLQRIAKEIVGIDVSAKMLAQTKATESIKFIHASAESLPFPKRYFDLVTVGMAFHWFKQTAFLNEVNRVLKQDGWLVIYNSWMTNRMKNCEAFSIWVKDQYLERYSSPKRGQPIAQEEAFGSLVKQGEESFEEAITMNKYQLLNYLTTQSNITRVLDEESETLSEIRTWLEAELSSFYSTESQQTIIFGARIGYYRLEEV
ncbi:MAG: class I SAM-dependent methyltransferase [Bacteroidota bacterium]